MATIEFIGYIFADLIFERLGYRQCTKLFVISFIMSIIIGIGMIINDAEKNPTMDIILTYVGKFFIAIGY